MPIEDLQIRSVAKKGGFAGDVLKLLSGATFAQAVSILAAPILARLYAPEAYGILALFGSITGIMGVIVCMRYELAIMLPKSYDEAANLLGVSLGFVLLVSLLTVPLVWLGRGSLLSLLNTPDLGYYLWLVPPSVFVAGVFLALSYWNSRTNRFGRLSIANVTNSLITTPMTLCLGLAGHVTAGSMIGAGIMGQTVTTALLGGHILREERKILLQSIRWRAMLEGAKRYKKFPLFDSWAGLMNVVSVQLPPLLLAVFFSSTVVGFYALGYRLLTLPFSLIGGAIGQVFFQRAAVAKNDGTLPLVVRKTFVQLVAFGSFPILLVMIIGEEIFVLVFGNRWIEAGLYAQILAPWILFVFFGSPISTLFSVLELQGSFLLFNSVLLVTRVGSLIAGGLMGSVLMALILYSGTGVAMWIGFCAYLLNKAGLTIQLMGRDILWLMFIAIISLAPIAALKACSTRPLYIVGAGCLCAFLYYTMIYFKDKELQEMVKEYAGRFTRSV